MTNSTNNISADVSMNGQTRGGDQFQVPGSNPVQGWHLLSRSPHHNCLSNGRNARLSRVWRCNTISFASKFKLYKSLVTSILLYGCKPWTLLVGSEKRIQAFETKCMRKLLRISYVEHKTNDSLRSKMRSKINFLMDAQETLLATVKRWKLHGSSMSHAITSSLQPSFKAPLRVGDAVVSGGNAGWTASKSGHPCPCQNCSQWPPAEKKKNWKRISAESFLMCLRRPSRARD